MLSLYDLPAPAKLNLFLHVVGRREDGYHLLQSIFALIDWTDTLHLERRSDGAIRRHDLSDALPADDLCTRAARLLQTQSACAFGADIHIDKRLPSGAGMGGGSSDAATVLIGLNRLWGVNWPLSRLLPLGLSLGADVPFFLGGRNAFVEGIGEQLTPITLPSQRFAVIKPPTSIATAEIFSSPLLARSEKLVIVAGFPADQNLSENKAAAEAENRVGNKVVLDTDGVARLSGGSGRNDLQAPAEARCPEVAQAAALLKACFGNSRMTGSGSAVFARICEENGMSDQPMATLPKDLPSGWVGKICRSLDAHPLRGWARD